MNLPSNQTSPPSSSKELPPRLAEILDLIGPAVLLPVTPARKSPSFKAWQQTTLADMARPEYLRRFGPLHNIGVLLGEPSNGLCSIDLDADEWVAPFLAANPQLATSLRTRRSRGCNFWFRILGEYPPLTKLHHTTRTGTEGQPLDVGEFRSTGGQTLIAGEVDGVSYRMEVAAPPVEIPFAAIIWPDFISDPPKLNGSVKSLAVVTHDASALDLARLENVQRLSGGSIRARCPACSAGGGDRTGDHLLIEVSGRFGCAKYPGDHQHRKDIWKLAGNPAAPFAQGTGSTSADIRGFIVQTLLGKDAPFQQRAAVASAVVAQLSQAGQLFHHAELRSFETAMFFDGKRKRLERIRSDAFLSWLSDWLAVNRADNLFRHIQAAVETAALSSKTARAILPASYWHTTTEAVYLSNGDGQLVRLTARGLELCDNGTDGVLFAAGKTLAPWNVEALPADPFETCALFRNARTAANHGKDLLRAWFYSLPTCPRCKPPLCLSGEIGSGKTRLAAGMAELYGIPFNGQKVEESSEADFWPTLDAGGLVCFDNADSRTRWLADALACAATGGSQRRRRLYTNSDLVTLRANAWLILTTANPTFASDAGLADRLLLVRTHRADGDSSDSALSDEIAANRDAGLVHIAESIAAALKDRQPTPGGLNQRHPDFAAFAVRIGRALCREKETVAALQSAEADKAAFCLENDTVAAALQAYLNTVGTFTGKAAELLPHLVKIDSDLDGKFSAKRLGKRLTALWPHLQKVLATAHRETDRKGYTVFTLKPHAAEYAEFQTAFS